MAKRIIHITTDELARAISALDHDIERMDQLRVTAGRINNATALTYWSGKIGLTRAAREALANSRRDDAELARELMDHYGVGVK